MQNQTPLPIICSCRIQHYPVRAMSFWPPSYVISRENIGSRSRSHGTSSSLENVVEWPRSWMTRRRIFKMSLPTIEAVTALGTLMISARGPMSAIREE